MATKWYGHQICLWEWQQCCPCMELLKRHVIRRHDEIRDLMATLLRDVSRAVETEPSLQPLTSEVLTWKTSNCKDSNRLDMKCYGSQDAFMDASVYNPLVSSNLSASREALFRRHECEKRRAYDQRVWEIKHTCFTPLIFSVTGGIGPSVDIFYKRLAHPGVWMWEDAWWCMPAMQDTPVI